jgi:hypothetical protein
MASHNFSFIVVTPEEFEDRMKADECARAATTASLPVTGAACKPTRKLSAPERVVPKLKTKNESLPVRSIHSSLHCAQVTTQHKTCLLSAVGEMK